MSEMGLLRQLTTDLTPVDSTNRHDAASQQLQLEILVIHFGSFPHLLIGQNKSGALNV